MPYVLHQICPAIPHFFLARQSGHFLSSQHLRAILPALFPQPEDQPDVPVVLDQLKNAPQRDLRNVVQILHLPPSENRLFNACPHSPEI